MSEQTIEAPEIVERDDYNNANLGTYEVTWENGAVEEIRAHWVIRPQPDLFNGSSDEHIKFVGWYDGVHRTILSARPDRIRCIRDLGVLPSLPDVNPDEPGQVEPEPAAHDMVRLTALESRVKAGETIRVFHPNWNDGEPVLLRDVMTHGDDIPEGRIGVRYSFVDGDGEDTHRIELVPTGALVALCGGAE
jgi:hypothetical protein